MISPVLLKDTTEEVVRAPSAFEITSEVLSGFTHAMTELVVPKSIPTTNSFAILHLHCIFKNSFRLLT